MADTQPTIHLSTTQPTKRDRGCGRTFQRGNVFWIAYYLRGKEFRESSGTSDEKKARRFLKHRLKEVGADQIGVQSFIAPKQQRVTVSELLDNLEADYKLRGIASPQFNSHLRHVREHFGVTRAIEITAAKIDAYIEDRLASGARPATINRSTQLLGQAFKLAVERKELTSAPKPRHLSEKDNARQGFFAEREFRAVMQNLPDYLQDFALFAYLVGWRKGEIASLAWADVDGDCIRLRAENSKNGEGRLIVLEGELAALIERRRAARKTKTTEGVTTPAKSIFHREGLPIGDIRKAWATASKLAGVHRLFHDLRRTAVRNMIRAGVGEKVAMQVSGHKTHSMLDRYNIVSEADLRHAMRRTQDYLNVTEETQPPAVPAIVQ